MSTRKQTMEDLQPLLAGAGNVRFKSMFGEYGMYLDEKFIGCLADERLFLKVTKAGEEMIGKGHEAPPYPGAKDHLLVPVEKMNDPEWLCAFLQTTADELPDPKPKTQSKARASKP